MTKANLTAAKEEGKDSFNSDAIDEMILELGKIRALGDTLAMIDDVQAFNQDTFNALAWEIVFKCDKLYKLITGEEKVIK